MQLLGSSPWTWGHGTPSVPLSNWIEDYHSATYLHYKVTQVTGGREENVKKQSQPMAVCLWNEAVQKVQRYHQKSFDFTYSGIKARQTGQKVSYCVTNDREKKI